MVGCSGMTIAARADSVSLARSFCFSSSYLAGFSLPFDPLVLKNTWLPQEHLIHPTPRLGYEEIPSLCGVVSRGDRRAAAITTGLIPRDRCTDKEGSTRQHSRHIYQHADDFMRCQNTFSCRGEYRDAHSLIPLKMKGLSKQPWLNQPCNREKQARCEDCLTE